MSRTVDVVVVGAGFAGAATAYNLVRRGAGRVVLLEQEDLPGRHASGNNAAVARRLVVNESQLPFAIEGIRFMEEPPDDFPQGVYFYRTGSMLVGGPEMEGKLRASIELSRANGVSGCWLSAEEVARVVPVTSGGSFVGGAYGSEDGVADVAALLRSYLAAARAHGLEVLTGRRLVSVEAEGGRVTAVQTDDQRISTPAVVNAAGAWAREVGARAGASDVRLRSLKRHLMVTGPLPWVDRTWPPVWDLSHEVYFRPEPPGLLLSPCDATPSDPERTGADGAAVELLAEKLSAAFPQLPAVSVAKTWAGMRTFTEDGNPVVGEDPALGGFFWCAGLGGNGMTLSPAIGRLTAEALLGASPPAAFDPRRYAA